MLRINSIRQLSAETHSKKHNLKDADELRLLAGFMNIREMKRNASILGFMLQYQINNTTIHLSRQSMLIVLLRAR
jgi:hypothetical protein